MRAMDTPATRLRKAREARFDTASEAARAFGWKVSTYIHHENGTREFDRSSAAQYARAFGVSASYLLMLARESESNSHPVVGLPVLAEAAIGVWREPSVEIMPHQAEKLSVPSVLEWKAEDEYAVPVGDRSIDRFAGKGEFVICRPIRPGPIDTSQFETNDFVHIERNRRGLKEISVRRVRGRDGPRLRLSTYSSDPKIKSEITYPTKPGGEQVVIRGLVVGKYARIKS